MIAGEKAPDFTLHDHTGQPRTLSGLLSGGPVVLFFYPIASSPGCTAEACHFRDLSTEFAAVGAQRVGISTDTVDKQAHFAQQRSFDFPLLSDADGEVSELFGVRRGRLGKLRSSVMERQGAGRGRHTRRHGLLARLLPVTRTTFVIDTDRTVLNVLSDELRPTVHADQALWFLQNYKLSGSSPPVRERLESVEAPETPVRIVEGDLFAQHGDLVINMCDTFDTAVPDIIERSSVLAGALDRLYGIDVDKMDADLDGALQSVPPVGDVAKKGKTVRYPLGTVAVVDRPPRKLFYLACATMDEGNTAHGTAGGLWESLNSLWTAVSEQGGGTICMPVIGGGVVPAQESIRLTVLSFMFATRSNKVCDELRIVVAPQDYHRLDQLELEAFLTSFKPA